MQNVITKNAKETQQFAYKFAKELQDGSVILLFGDLGAGKTTFTQGLAEGLGIIHRIVSPTFIIMRSYEFNKKESGGKMNFYHIDLYRTENQSGIQSAGVFDILGKSHTLTVVEWPEKFDSLPEKRIEIHFKKVDNEEREITIQQYE